MWKYIHGVNMNTQIVPDCSSTVERPAHNRRGCGFESRQSDQTQPTDTDRTEALAELNLFEYDRGDGSVGLPEGYEGAISVDAFETIRTALTSAPSVPDGWRKILIPNSLTRGMVDAGWNAGWGKDANIPDIPDENIIGIFEAMLAAAPTPSVCAENEHTEEMF